MQTALYWIARSLIAMVQALPLVWVARLGAAIGGCVYWLDARHRRVAIQNLTHCFGHERTAAEIRSLARANFRRIGENFACAIRTAAMSDDEIREVLQMTDDDGRPFRRHGDGSQGTVVAIGHFGNFELYARTRLYVSADLYATTYRGLREPWLDRLVQSLRRKSGCVFFERRRDARALKAALSGRGVILGLLADQHAGDRGERLPFFGRDCSTSVAPAVLALRYGCRLHTGICFRTAPGRWRVEYGREIPTHRDGHPRPVAEIATEMNARFEAAIRRDPVNWFWVHNRWKPSRRATAPMAEESVAADADP
jgi:lauroyl/myristoyl acyltransferase